MKTGRFAFSAVAAVLTALGCARQSVEARLLPPPSATPPEVGTEAPNFSFTPVTMSGIGKATRLSALKGQTTVVWFFPKARTRG